MTRYPVTEPRKKNVSNDTNFCHLQDIYPLNMRKIYWILLEKYD